MASLTIANLYKSFGQVEVLKGIDLEADEGEFIVLVGPSGCGKSTLLAIIAGLERASGGDVLIGNRIVNDVHPKDRDIAMVFQTYALYPTMTVRENLTFGLEVRRIAKAEQQEAVKRVSQFLKIDQLLDRRPSQLSGGQRQRVAMGRALVRNPVLFLFDEPLSNLDAKLRVEMRTEIKKLHQALKTTVVYVTHDQIEAMTLASRIAVMHAGQIQQYADPQTTYEKPANLFVASFMGALPMNLAKATLVNDSGYRVQVRDERGGTIDLPVPNPHSDMQAFAGREVILGIRSEQFGRRELLGDDIPPHVGMISCNVEVTEPTGAETMVVFRFGNEEMVARIEPEHAPEPGDQIHLSVDMRKACLFDPQTEQRIGA
ncbi:MAG: sn-glycerol-3-phosphate ABC transporter ATP-binding protein UgpC [Pseudomonadota bacterium]